MTTIGIVGGGQLGRMMALAGYPLGLDFLFLDRSAETPAGQIAPMLCGEFTDPALLEALRDRSELITFDWENVPVEPLRALGKKARIAPPLRALAASQDRLSEKRLFTKLGIPTNDYTPVDSQRDLDRAIARIGLPAVIKTRRLGYDGKGQRVLRSPRDIEGAFDALGGVPLLCEAFVPFDYEISIIGARSTRGEIAIYPLNANVHHEGILRLTRAPFGRDALASRAASHLRKVLEHFRYAGVLTIEFFVRGGRLIANEMAPRVHNSGHWTIEGAETSQFENHLRAVLGWPLGSTRARGHSAMLNLVGTLPDMRPALALPGAHWHDYGKTPRPGRKLGHCTIVAPTAAKCVEQVGKLVPRLGAAFPGDKVKLSIPRG